MTQDLILCPKVSLRQNEHPEEARRLGENARRTAVTVYDWKILIRELEAFFERILTKADLQTA